MIFRKIKVWWRRVRRRRRFVRVLVVESMTEIPSDPGADIYVVRRGGLERRLVISCPCRCKRRIDVNLIAGRDPYWSLKLSGKRISLHPSIWLRSDPCQSHFFIRENRVIWVPGIRPE